MWVKQNTTPEITTNRLYRLMGGVFLFYPHYTQIPSKKRGISALESGQWGRRLLKALEFEVRWMRLVSEMGLDGHCYNGFSEIGESNEITMLIRFEEGTFGNMTILHWNIWNCFFS